MAEDSLRQELHDLQVLVDSPGWKRLAKVEGDPETQGYWSREVAIAYLTLGTHDPQDVIGMARLQERLEIVRYLLEVPSSRINAIVAELSDMKGAT